MVVSEDALESLPSDIRYLRLNAAFTVGTKRNVACEYARGDIICHWDDDDWSHPERIADQVAALGSNSLCGYQQMPFHDISTGAIWHWRDRGVNICGTSMMYRWDYWQAHPFRDMQIGEDVDFNKRCPRVKAMENNGRMVARFHGHSVTQGTAKFGGMTPGKWADLPEEYRRCETS